MPGSRIVLGLDGSSGAAAAAEWCAAHAGRLDAEVLAVHTVPPVVDGEPAAAIMELADEVDAVMVIVGRRGRGGFAELLLGSVPHRLTHHCDRPVLVVPAR